MLEERIVIREILEQGGACVYYFVYVCACAHVNFVCLCGA